MIGVQRQRDVERVRGQAARALAGQHVEEVRRVPEHRIGIDRPLPLRQPAHRRDQRADLRGQPHRLAVVGLRRVVVGVGIVVAERRGQRPQQVHAVAGGQRAHQALHAFGQRPRGDQLRLQVAELGARRQAAMPQQVADFFERRVPRQVVDVVTAVRQHAAIAIEVADRGRGGDGIFKAGFGLLGRAHNAQSYLSTQDWIWSRGLDHVAV